MDESGADSSFVEYSNYDKSAPGSKQRTGSNMTKEKEQDESFKEYSKEDIQKSKSQANTSMHQVNEMEELEFEDNS